MIWRRSTRTLPARPPGERDDRQTFVEAKRRGGLSKKLDAEVRALFPETRGLIVYRNR